MRTDDTQMRYCKMCEADTLHDISEFTQPGRAVGKNAICRTCGETEWLD
ncbi:hypothetical protein [Zhihengliuella halotolerans]|nr:hypothetical protein [Zhihengliuella halotolerans]